MKKNVECPHDCSHCRFYYEYFDDGWDYITKWCCDMGHSKKSDNCNDFEKPTWKDELGNFLLECGFGLFVFVIFIILIFFSKL